MAKISKTDLAWAAGVIDGEGCVYIARHKAGKYGIKVDWYHLGIKVTMGHEPTILRLRKMFGSGSKHRVEQIGWNPAYTWVAQANIARKVLNSIKPYCVTKAKEIKIALKFLKRPRWFGGRFRGPKSLVYQKMEYALWDKMRRLKPRTRYRLARLESKKGNGHLKHPFNN